MTNFVYKIENIEADAIDSETINAINTKQKIKDRITAIQTMDATLNFSKIENQVFHNNLLLLDSMLPHIVSFLLLIAAETGLSKLNALCEQLKERNPLNFDQSTGHAYYTYKITRLLTEMAVGMKSNEVWSGVHIDRDALHKFSDNTRTVNFSTENFQENLLKKAKLKLTNAVGSDSGMLYRENDELLFKLHFEVC